MLRLNENRIITHTSCNCPAGAGLMCKHICAVAYFINNDDGFSKTNLPQQWGKPSKSGQKKIQKRNQLEFGFTVELNQINLSTILYAQKLNIITLNLNIFLLDLKAHNFYYLYININDNKMMQVFNSTINQSNDLWKRERYFRKQGKINVTHGQQNEPIALEAFKQIYNKDVLNCGLIVDVKRLWLRASPDGLILNESGTIEKVLEIKCPISCKDKLIVDSNKNTNVKYLECDKTTGKLHLKILIPGKPLSARTSSPGSKD
ncbi:SWIM-type domain-containing protein [Aphis craccivora]|uniref:SWIM-type domain-containing protein n=1 Tax=Aphis craccivora TaxID=307492 RepID=A0A6G0VYT0_APHCR|nr:SWIM-type domain-containing protein [Aphis craccivora]